jgi:hypothetical protein
MPKRRDLLNLIPAAALAAPLLLLPTSAAQAAATTTLDTGKSCRTDAMLDGLYLVLNASDKPEGLTTGAGLMEVQVYSGRWVVQRLVGFNPGTQWGRMIDNQNPAAVPWQPQAAVTGIGNATLVTMGDSITAFGNYHPQLRLRLGSASIINTGIGGTQLVYNTAQTDWCEVSFVRLVDAICDNAWAPVDAAVAHLLANGIADLRATVAAIKAINFTNLRYMTALYGTNDFTAANLLGADTDDIRTTFYGALNYAVRRLATSFPNLRVGFVTTTYRSATFGAPGTFDPDTMTNSAGLYLRQYVDAVVDRCHALSLPVLDLYRVSGINKHNWANKLLDGVHPNPATGGIDIGNRIGGWLTSAF